MTHKYLKLPRLRDKSCLVDLITFLKGLIWKRFAFEARSMDPAPAGEAERATVHSGWLLLHTEKKTDTETGVGVAIQTLLREPSFPGLMVPGG